MNLFGAMTSLFSQQYPADQRVCIAMARSEDNEHRSSRSPDSVEGAGPDGMVEKTGRWAWCSGYFFTPPPMSRRLCPSPTAMLSNHTQPPDSTFFSARHRAGIEALGKTVASILPRLVGVQTSVSLTCRLEGGHLVWLYGR